MAENEILDLGKSIHYKRWRKALSDPSCSLEEALRVLGIDFEEAVQKNLRGPTLNIVLQACIQDPLAAREVVENFKDKGLANLVIRAYNMTQSRDPTILAPAIVDQLIDGVVGRANRMVFENRPLSMQDHLKLEKTASEKLFDQKHVLVEKLVASLSGKSVGRTKRVKKEKISAQSLLTTSLLLTTKKIPLGASHA